jgi:hypothetical protein
MVGADFEGSLASHQQANFVGGFVFQEAHIARAALLPFLERCIEAKQFGTTFFFFFR